MVTMVSVPIRMGERNRTVDADTWSNGTIALRIIPQTIPPSAGRDVCTSAVCMMDALSFVGTSRVAALYGSVRSRGNPSPIIISGRIVGDTEVMISCLHRSTNSWDIAGSRRKCLTTHSGAQSRQRRTFDHLAGSGEDGLPTTVVPGAGLACPKSRKDKFVVGIKAATWKLTAGDRGAKL